jgi:hypothetical protein
LAEAIEGIKRERDEGGEQVKKADKEFKAKKE